MKWTRPERGAERTRSGFLWFPKRMINADGNIETRWLERAKWKQMFFEEDAGWVATHWINDA